VQLAAAAEWLAQIQNSKNGGWGRTPELASSIVNTAEAMFVLNVAGREQYRPAVKKGAEFIERVTAKSLRERELSRFAFFALLAATVNRADFPMEFVAHVVEWALSARNPDGAWGNKSRDGESRLYPTAMMILALNKLGRHEQLETAKNWLLSSRQDNGWSFSAAQGPSPVATSIAVVALRDFLPETDSVFSQVKTNLLTIESWVTAKEDMPGADWVHSAHMWGFSALTALGVEPYVKPIAEGVRELNTLTCRQGWREPDGHLTVRGQYWAVMAFEALHKAFDPAVHVYQIDSARAQSIALEPKFVVIRPHTPWTVTLPAVAYRWITYGLLFLAGWFFLGLNRLTPDPGKYGDFLLGLLSFLGAWTLIKKRRSHFPKWGVRLLLSGMAIVTALHLILGWSVAEIWERLTFSH
jgi:hypothetical protein